MVRPLSYHQQNLVIFFSPVIWHQCYSKMGRSSGLFFDPPSTSLEDVESDSAEKAFA